MSWDQKRIRRTFLDYFAQHPKLPHTEVPSGPIIPRDDPTLLFTNAGMNQFKATLLGLERRDYSRACSVQTCMRVGGKHNDLDAVGKDGRHLTWFEMLGNWSFGDYYKLQAIEMAWDLSVRVFGLDPTRIYASVYKDDDESYGYWAREIGLPPKRIYRFGDVERGDEENFWSMGPTGPCGPCTELYYDLGPEAGDGPGDVMGGDGDRYCEFWNNVFMAHDRAEDGRLTPLAFQSVDTGMGMERITMILQGKTSVYETDLFGSLILETQRLAGCAPYSEAGGDTRVHLQVIADHLRALTFVVSEGGQFQNEGRGYVLRRILRRAVHHGRLLGLDGPFLWRLVPAVGALFEGVYDLPAHILENTQATLREEERRFFRTIDRGMDRIEAMLAAKAGDDHQITGAEAFTLHDTFGFPVDLTGIIAEERGYSVDTAGFEAAMEAQRARSREGGTFCDDEGDWTALAEGIGRGFAGYGLVTHETTVVRWRQGAEGRLVLVLASTPLYPESGGEVADRGTLEAPGLRIAVEDVKKVNGVVHHVGRLESGDPATLRGGTAVQITVDVERRRRKTLHHTATHLLHAALRQVLGPHVEQKGSVVEPDRLRFDFSHSAPLSQAELDAVVAWTNSEIRLNTPVEIDEDVPIEEARAAGVVALFGEKYGDRVRTVRSGPSSFELCGGNHARRTGDIGHVIVTAESGVAAGVRRLEAVAGHAADAAVHAQRALLRAAAARAKADVARLPERVGQLQQEIRDLKRALEAARRGGVANDLQTLLQAQVQVAGAPLVAAKVTVDSRETLAALADRVRDNLPAAIVVLGAELGGKAVIIAAVGPKSRDRFHAGRIVRQVAERVDGRGGGRPDFAQAGGSAPGKLAGAMAEVPAIVEALLAP